MFTMLCLLAGVVVLATDSKSSLFLSFLLFLSLLPFPSSFFFVWSLFTKDCDEIGVLGSESVTAIGVTGSENVVFYYFLESLLVAVLRREFISNICGFKDLNRV